MNVFLHLKPENVTPRAWLVTSNLSFTCNNVENRKTKSALYRQGKCHLSYLMSVQHHAD